MNVSLYSKPSVSGDMLSGAAASVCTGSYDWERSLRGAMNAGHESVAEHVTYTFYIEGVSRVLLAQLTRHRIASFSVQSQRYCQIQPEFVLPKTIDQSRFRPQYLYQCDRAYEAYTEMIKSGIPEEDARYIIPQSVKTNLMLTMNARELRHFFSLRCCNRAQWEIRELANQMQAICLKEAPELFKNSGPGCVRGKCPEGIRSCGRPVGGKEHGS